MHHLVLKKGLSYWGKVKADKDHPDVFVPDGPEYEAAMASGYFKEEGDEQPEEVAFEEETGIGDEDTAQESSDSATELSKMTVAELKQYATIKGIPLGSDMKKEAILKAIEEAEAKADQIRAGFREKS